LNAPAPAAAPAPARTPSGDWADPDRGPRRTVAAMVALVVLFIVVAGVWAVWAQLDVAVQARGAVVPPSRLQEVTSLEGGIVKEMRVAAGERVQRGQLLARLDTAGYEASFGESRQQWLGAMAGRERSEALLAGRAPQFDPAVLAEAPDLVAKETQLWRDTLQQHQSAQAAAAEAVARRRGEIVEAEARIAALQRSVAVAEEAFAIEERLLREGAGARADYLTAQQRLLGQRAELDALRQSLPRLQAALAEARAAQAESDARARAQWGQQRAEFQTRAAALASTLGGRADAVARREVLSPVDGVVNRVLVGTIGGVVQAGRPIVEIVPDEPRLLMNVRVRPADVGFLHAGQQANVRVLAYDPATFGQLRAEVARVGADAVLDERGEPYFEVQLSAAREQLRLHGQPLPVTPGMPVDVSILTGERSVAQYLLKPVLRGVQGALQER
jgi:adhesin transport system membrane fusion protein